MNKASLAAGLLLLLATIRGQAQEAVRMRDVEVVADRRLRDAGLQQTRLDTAVLRQHPALSMADLLTRHSTLFVKSYGRATESTAEFRGTSPSHTQVLWNGLPINSPMLGTVDFSYIPSYFIDEATLLHGASSLTATGGGLGGAIRLTTRPPQEEGTALHYIQGIGSYHTWDQMLHLAHTTPRWSGSTRACYSTSQNDFTYTNRDKKTDVRDEAGHIIRSYHPTERNQSGYWDDLHLQQDLQGRLPRGGRIEASAWYTHSRRGLPFLSVDYKDDNRFTNEHLQDALRASLAWRHTHATWSTTLRAGYALQHSRYEHYSRRDTVITYITQAQNRMQTLQLQGEADWIPAEAWLVSLQGTAQHEHVHSTDRTPFHTGDNQRQGRMRTSLVITARWRPLPRLSLAALVRQESHGQALSAPIPALFAEYSLHQPTGLVLKASATRNYRHPTLSDLYYQPGGNPDLRPERGLSADLGLEMRLRRQGHEWEANLSGFHSLISDWILWTPNSKGYWQPANVKKVRSYGIEATTAGILALPRTWRIGIRANYAWTPSINLGEGTNGNDTSRGKQLTYVPRHSANLMLRLHWREWALAYSWVHYSQRYTTTSNETARITGRLLPYHMSHLTLERTLRLPRLHLDTKLAVNNLLSARYITVLSRPMPGRNVELFLGFKPQIKKRK